jgi:hypothetical protein
VLNCQDGFAALYEGHPRNGVGYHGFLGFDRARNRNQYRGFWTVRRDLEEVAGQLVTWNIGPRPIQRFRLKPLSGQQHIYVFCLYVDEHIGIRVRRVSKIGVGNWDMLRWTVGLDQFRGHGADGNGGRLARTCPNRFLRILLFVRQELRLERIQIGARRPHRYMIAIVRGKKDTCTRGIFIIPSVISFPRCLILSHSSEGSYHSAPIGRAKITELDPLNTPSLATWYM